MDNREVPMVGTMKDVEVKIATFLEATYKMDVIVTNTKSHYGMLLSRQWAAPVGGNMQLDLSYATILVNGNQVNLYREPCAPRVIEKMDPDMLNCMIDVDLDNFKVQPIQPQLRNTDPIVNELESQQEVLWHMYFDGAFSKEGAGARVLFVSPSCITFKYSFLLAFKCINNTAEYKTLLLGLEIAKKHGIQLLKVSGDLELVVSHIRSKYASKNDRLKRYKHSIWDVIEHFCAFSINWIERLKNIMANLLANVAL